MLLINPPLWIISHCTDFIRVMDDILDACLYIFIYTIYSSIVLCCCWRPCMHNGADACAIRDGSSVTWKKNIRKKIPVVPLNALHPLCVDCVWFYPKLCTVLSAWNAYLCRDKTRIYIMEIWRARQQQHTPAIYYAS